MKTKSGRPIFSEKEIQDRLEHGKRISKEEFQKKLKSPKVSVTK